MKTQVLLGIAVVYFFRGSTFLLSCEPVELIIYDIITDDLNHVVSTPKVAINNDNSYNLPDGSYVTKPTSKMYKKINLYTANIPNSDVDSLL
jgi:hypothetical protein